MKGIRETRMKKSLLIIVLLSCVLAVAYTGGNNETAATPASFMDTWSIKVLHNNDDSSIMEMRPAYRKNLGMNELSLTFNDASNPLYAIGKIDGRYFNLFTGKELAWANIGNLFNAQNDTGAYSVEQTKTSVMSILSAATLLSRPDTVFSEQLAHGDTDNVIRIVWYNTTADQNVEIALFYENKQVKLNVKLLTEFFPGEREFFASRGSGTYTQKALALLNSFIGEDFVTRTGSKIDSTMNGSWNMFDSVNEKLRNEQITKLKIALGQHFNIRYQKVGVTTYPYMDFGKEEFEALYGSNYNIYVKAYLDFCFRKNKPPLAYLVQKTHACQAFDYTQYRTITNAEGEEIVNAALRYLTWGVEYTSRPVNMITVPKPGPTVYKDNKDTIINWVTGNQSTDRWSLFYPGYTGDADNEVTSARTQTAPAGTTHRILSDPGQSSFVIAGRKTDNPFQLQKINIWTAKSIDLGLTESADILINGQMGSHSIICDGKLSTGIPGIGTLALSMDQQHTVGAVAFIGKRSGNLTGIRVLDNSGKPLTVDSWNVTDSDNGRWNMDPATYSADNFETYVALLKTGHQTNVLRLSFEGDENASFEIREIFAFTKNPVAYLKNDSSGIADFYSIIKKPKISSHEGNYLYRSHTILQHLLFNTTGASRSLDGTGKVIATAACNIKDKETSQNYGVLNYHENVEIWDHVSTTNNNIRYETRRADGLEGSNLLKFQGKDEINRDKNRFLLHIDLNTNAGVEEIVLYEAGNNTVLTAPLQLFTGATQLLEEVFLQSEHTEQISGTGLTTPFKNVPTGNETLQNVAGNPLPFVWRGIDNPRSFAWKMYSQAKARENYAGSKKFYTTDTTRALDSGGIEHFQSGYLDHSDYQGISTGYPFLPGFRAERDYEYSALGRKTGNHYPANAAGVDAPGLLTGALAMTSLSRRYFDIMNSRPAVLYERYMEMKYVESPPVKGLDHQGKPEYHRIMPVTTDYRDDYRINWHDMEKMTILVPDISEIQPGDLIVNYGYSDDQDNDTRNDYLHMGIVVKTEWGQTEPAYGSGYAERLAQIYVLTTAHTIEAVTIGTWGNSTGMYGGLTTESGDFHIRRLIALKENESPVNLARGTKDSWEVIDDEIEALAVRIEFPNDSSSLAAHNMDRWIPNTGEMHTVGNIFVARETGMGTFRLPEDRSDIVLLGPADMYYKAGSNTATEGNIYNNAGTAFGFYALNDPADTTGVRIATFTPVTGEGRTRENSYTVVYDTNFFHNEGEDRGKGTGDNYLRVSKNSEILEAHIGTRDYSIFGIKATGTIRPGDDILLRFALLQDNSVIGEARPGDFMAVYDKKMLWRANLYIDEGTGISDWNNVHPWNAPPNQAASVQNAPAWWSEEWGYNEWNYQGMNFDGTNFQFTSQGDGRQVVAIHEWTRRNTGDMTYPNSTERDSVAYGPGGCDSPQEFNWKLEQQRNALTAYYGEGSIETLGTNPSPADHRDWSPSTTEKAPDDIWVNYLKGNLQNGAYRPLSITVNGQTQVYYPYRPGLRTAISYGNYTENGIASNWSATRFQAGLDCTGFTQRCMSYAGSPYWLGADGALRFLDGTEGIDHWNLNNNTNRYFSDHGGWGNVLLEIGQDNVLENIDDPLPFSEVIPGDIIKFYDASNTDRHTAIVCNVTRSFDGTLYRSNITFIESASGLTNSSNYRRYTVMKQTWKEYKSELPSWTYKVYRLRVGE